MAEHQLEGMISLALTPVTALSNAVTWVTLIWTLVFASRIVRHRFFTGLANIGEVIFHTGLDAAQAVCAKFFHVSSTGLYCYSLEHQGLTGLG